MPRLSLRVFIGCVTVVLLAVSTANAQWTIDDVDSPRDIRNASVALDSLERPVVAYGGEALRFAIWDGSQWLYQDVDYSGCSYRDVSLALDGFNNPVVSYYDLGNGDLKIARHDGTSWTIETVDSIGDVGRRSSLRLDGAGLPVMSYLDKTNETVKLARYDGASWNLETVGRGDGQTSLALDSAFRPVISYREDIRLATCLTVARHDGFAWQIESVACGEEVGDLSSLELDNSDRPVVSYYHFDTNTEVAVRLARHDGTDWQIETIARLEAAATSLALDPAGNPVVGIADHVLPLGWWPQGTLWLARFAGSTWTMERVAGNDIDGVSLVLNAAGEAVIASWETFYSDEIELTRQNGPDFVVERVDASAWSGGGSSVALDPLGRPAVAHLTNFGLRYATYDGSAWMVEDVHNRTLDYGPPSLAFDGNGRPMISFQTFDPSQFDNRLLLARFNGSSWVTETILRTSDWGFKWGSLTADGAGRPAICAASSAGVELARFDGSIWQFETIDPDWSRNCALATDASGHPAASYDQSGELKLARFDGSAWSIETVATKGLYGSLAFGPSGEPMISYFDDATRQQMLARRVAGSWSLEKVTAVGVRASQHSLAVGSGDRPWIAFLDSSNQTLNVATDDGSGWTIETLDDRVANQDLVVTSAGRLFVSYYSICRSALRVARTGGIRAQVYRGVVANLAPGWKPAALPLDDTNDEPVGPFPIDTTLGEREVDTLTATEPLVIYRALVGADDAGNVLRVVKNGGAVELYF